MIIDGLPTLTTPTTGDEMPIERGQATYKVSFTNLKNAITGRAELVLSNQTVDANGNINTGLDAGANTVIVARCSGYIVTPWVSGSTTTWWAHLTTFTGAAVSSGMSVGTVRVYYYDL